MEYTFYFLRLRLHKKPENIGILRNSVERDGTGKREGCNDYENENTILYAFQKHENFKRVLLYTRPEVGLSVGGGVMMIV